MSLPFRQISRIDFHKEKLFHRQIQHINKRIFGHKNRLTIIAGDLSSDDKLAIEEFRKNLKPSDFSASASKF